MLFHYHRADHLPQNDKPANYPDLLPLSYTQESEMPCFEDDKYFQYTRILQYVPSISFDVFLWVLSL